MKSAEPRTRKTGRRKGQIFTLDFLASVAIAVVILAAITVQFEQAYQKADDLEYQKVKQLALDVSQIAVKAILNSSENRPNNVTLSKQPDMTALLNAYLPQEYGFQIDSSSMSSWGHGGCGSARQYIVKISRMVYNKPTKEQIDFSVCR